MRRAIAFILCAALVASAWAADASQAVAPVETPAAPGVLPGRSGYAFDRPEVLIRQRLFGLAHGLSLLAAACLDLPEHSTPIQDAYAAWHAKQDQTIQALARDLALYYFGPRAPEAQWPDLARALNLGASIHPALGEISLADACASLPEAIARPRYQFDKLLAESSKPAATETSGRAVPPAPTSLQPAE